MDFITGSSTSTPLNNGQTFTGEWAGVDGSPSVVYALLADTSGILYIDFSPDQTNVDSTLTFNFTANNNEVHRVTVTRKYCRVRITNNSGSNQTFLRGQGMAGGYFQLTSSLNSVIQRDADALSVRPIDFNIAVAESLYQNTQNTIKDGLNADISSGTVPEDIWSVGGTYTGFPTGATEEGQIVVGGADTGTVYYSYLESDTSTDYVFATKAIAGAGNYDLGHNIWRCNFAYFVGSSATAFNAGLITIRHKTTTANVFTQIPIGFSQSYTSAYTVPFGSAIYIDRISGGVRGSTSGSMDGYFWYRGFGESPRLRFPFTLQFGSLYFDDVDYLVRIPERTDIIPRIQVASTNNLSSQISYRIIKIRS